MLECQDTEIGTAPVDYSSLGAFEDPVRDLIPAIVMILLEERDFTTFFLFAQTNKLINEICKYVFRPYFPKLQEICSTDPEAFLDLMEASLTNFKFANGLVTLFQKNKIFEKYKDGLQQTSDERQQKTEESEMGLMAYFLATEDINRIKPEQLEYVIKRYDDDSSSDEDGELAKLREKYPKVIRSLRLTLQVIKAQKEGFTEEWKQYHSSKEIIYFNASGAKFLPRNFRRQKRTEGHFFNLNLSGGRWCHANFGGEKCVFSVVFKNVFFKYCDLSEANFNNVLFYRSNGIDHCWANRVSFKSIHVIGIAITSCEFQNSDLKMENQASDLRIENCSFTNTTISAKIIGPRPGEEDTYGETSFIGNHCINCIFHLNITNWNVQNTKFYSPNFVNSKVTCTEKFPEEKKKPLAISNVKNDSSEIKCLLPSSVEQQRIYTFDSIEAIIKCCGNKRIHKYWGSYDNDNIKTRNSSTALLSAHGKRGNELSSNLLFVFYADVGSILEKLKEKPKPETCEAYNMLLREAFESLIELARKNVVTTHENGSGLESRSYTAYMMEYLKELESDYATLFGEPGKERDLSEEIDFTKVQDVSRETKPLYQHERKTSNPNFTRIKKIFNFFHFFENPVYDDYIRIEQAQSQAKGNSF